MTDPETPNATWLGHAGVRIQTPEGKTILIDPWPTGPTWPDGTDTSNVDAILVTHGHFDHFQDVPRIAKESGATVVAIHEVAQFLLAQGLAEDQVIGMNKGGTIDVAGCQVTMVSADHSSGITTDDGIVDGGQAAGYVVKLGDGVSVYHSGDTNLFSDLGLIGELYRPTTGFVCIGGHFTMTPREAAIAAQRIGLKRVVPIHWGTFPLLAGTPDELASELEGTGIDVVRAEIGATFALALTSTATQNA